jgi:hypothetical protein
MNRKCEIIKGPHRPSESILVVKSPTYPDGNVLLMNVVAGVELPFTKAEYVMVSGISTLVTRGGSRTGIAVQASPADCAYSMARRVCVDIDSISADVTRRVAVPVLVRVYAFVADCTPRPAVAVAIGADVLTANPACRVAVLISVGVLAATADSTCRMSGSIHVKDAILAVGRKN